MKGCAAFLLAATYAASLSVGQTSSVPDFVIDDAQPYVYLKFDHFGRRAPVNERESAKGIWLRLVNNCRLPISVRALNPGTGDPGVILNYEVVAAPGQFGPSPQQRKYMPSGYSADLGTLATIPPKADLLFSVPAESIAEQWYIQVRFSFVFPKPRAVAEHPSGAYDPYSVADFTWYNVPEEIRKTLAVTPGSRRQRSMK